jgi:potassium channel subfamily K
MAVFIAVGCILLLCCPQGADGLQLTTRSTSRIVPISRTSQASYRAFTSDSSTSRIYLAAPKNDDSEKEIRKDLPTIFLRSLWKGITLPYPALRRIVVQPSSQDSNRKMAIGSSLRECLLALAVYLSTGVLAYTVFLEKWSVVDALYFTSVSFSTVGYGDLCPSNAASKLFTCFFGIVGITCLGTAVATIGGQFIQAEIEAVNVSRHASRSRLVKLFDGMPKVLKHYRGEARQEQLKALQAAQEEVKQKLEKPIQWSRAIRKGVLRVLPSLSIIFGGSLIVQILNGKAWLLSDTIYYGLITASTIGFGDFSPQTRAARIFAIAYIPLAVAAAGEILSGIALALVQRRQREVYNRQLQNDLTINHLRAMDADGDGQITRDEYIQFMLIEMGLVSADDLNELSTQFERLDVTRSGTLDKEDLALMAELRGATVKRSGED